MTVRYPIHFLTCSRSSIWVFSFTYIPVLIKICLNTFLTFLRLSSMFLTFMRPKKTFSTHILPKLLGMNVIKHFKCCLYFLMFLLSYFRVERYECLICVSDLWVFFYTFDIFPFFVRRFELKIDWGMIIFAELNFWLIIVHCWNAEKISSISYTNQLFLSNLSKKYSFWEKIRFFL